MGNASRRSSGAKPSLNRREIGGISVGRIAEAVRMLETVRRFARGKKDDVGDGIDVADVVRDPRDGHCPQDVVQGHTHIH